MSPFDDDGAYEPDDPKHPGFAEMWLDYVDTLRKRERENPVTCAYEDVDESGGVKDAA